MRVSKVLRTSWAVGAVGMVVRLFAGVVFCDDGAPIEAGLRAAVVEGFTP